MLPLTIDSYYLLAVIENTTSSPNRIKFIGGTLSEEDIDGDVIKPYNCIKRESNEEIGLDLNNSYIESIAPKYIITRPNFSFINILYEVNLKMTCREIEILFENHINNLKKENKDVELKKIIFIKNDKNEIKDFLNKNRNNLIDYLEELFLVLIQELEAKDILEELGNKR